MISGIAIGNQRRHTTHMNIDNMKVKMMNIDRREDDRFDEMVEKEWKDDWLDYYGKNVDFNKVNDKLESMRMRNKPADSDTKNKDSTLPNIRSIMDDQIVDNNTRGGLSESIDRHHIDINVNERERDDTSISRTRYIHTNV